MRVTAPVASAAERDRGGYRIIVPADARITWLGEVNGKSTSGTYTGSDLAANWKRMGYRDGMRAFTTLSWLPKGAERHARMVVRLTNPRIDDAGRLVFVAKTRGMKLPRTLKEFSLDIAQSSALRQSRWSLSFNAFNIDSGGTGQIKVTSANDTKAAIDWPQPGNSANPTCRTTINVNAGKGEVDFPGFACGTGQVNGSNTGGYPSYIDFYPSSAPFQGGLGSVYACFGYTPQSGFKTDWCQTIAQWNSSGQKTM